MKMVAKKLEYIRWKIAQRYESLYWKKYVTNPVNNLNWYRWRASEFEKRINSWIDERQKEEVKILEIGSGPAGIISFLKWGKRFSVDPLETYYVKDLGLKNIRNPNVLYIEGRGESLPFKPCNRSCNLS